MWICQVCYLYSSLKKYLECLSVANRKIKKVNLRLWQTTTHFP